MIDVHRVMRMECKNILFLDTGSDSELHLNFFLHMAGYRTLNFRTLDEAVNWGATCARPEDTLCVLINAPGNRKRMEKDLRLYRDRAAHLPIVLIDPENGRHESDMSDIADLIICAPEEVPEALKSLQK